VTVASIDSSPTTGIKDVAGFGDRLADRVAARESQLVLGLDPDPARLWPAAIRLADAQHGAPSPSPSPALRAARAVAAHCALAIEAVAEQCVAVKLQVACFERLGPPGWSALAETAARGRESGLLVIADAKRGDVEVTAAAYAQAFLGETPTPYGPVAGLGADALTVNPLLGRDSLEPFLATARAHRRGLFVLVRTSNPGASDVQKTSLAGGGTVSELLADLVEEIGAVGVGHSGLSDIGAVVGATAPDRMRSMRERMPRAPFLLPGVGAQGGRVEELAPVFAPGPAGGLISASRGIVAAYERAGGDPATAAAREASRLRELAWRLAA
jgi:orotidine-5'-phosphate decarboxylase